MKYLAIALLVLLLSGCNDMFADDAAKAVRSNGYTDIQYEGYAFFGCFKNAHFSGKFTAKDAAGNRVRVVVCGYSIFGYSVRTVG